MKVRILISWILFALSLASYWLILENIDGLNPWHWAALTIPIVLLNLGVMELETARKEEVTDEPKN